MRQHMIAIVSALLGLIGLASTGVLLFFVAGLVPLAAILVAFVALLGAFGALLAIVLVTNTRRPAGIDPNAPAPIHERDPFAQTSDELRRGVMMPDRNAYGRRGGDDPSVVRRLAEYFERDDAQRPAPESTPAWALDLQDAHPDELSREESQ